MTFGAMAAWQAWLLLAGAAGVAAWVFLLKLRPPRVIVPSLLLWRRVLDEVRDITLWERIRRAVSLIVTIVIALALAFAVTRPSPRASASAAAGDRRLIVIDSSWSMLARTRAGERRWDRGLAEARRLIASGGDIALATTADGIVEGPTTDLALLDTALDRIAPSGGDAATWPRLSDSDSVHFITDGAMARPPEANVVVHSVFEPASNVAITALDVRPSVGSANAGDAYLEIANYATSPQQVRVTLARGTASVLDRRIDIGAGETLRQVIPLARGADEILRAHVDAPANALEIDDEAWGWVGGSRPLKVTVVSQHPEWLKALFDHDPSVRATVLDPSAYGASPIDADVVIFDRWAPHDAPARPSLLFAPPLDTPWLSGDLQPAPAAPEERRPRWDVVGEHPIVRGVDPFTLIIEKARGYRSASLVSIAQSTRGTPLVAIAESPERRLVLVSFGPHESNLTAAPGFPVLVGNALEWLTHPATGLARRPGLMSFDGAIAKVTGPDGAAVPLVRVNHGSVGRLRTPGVYVAEGGGARSAVAVNVGDPQTSNLQRTSGGTTRNAQIVTAGASGWPWWIYCAVLAFILAVVEWWTWQRRITV